MPLAKLQVVSQTVPMFAAVYAWIFLGERWHLSEFFSALAAIAGVVFIVRPAPFFLQEAASTAGGDRALGVAFGLLSAVSSGGAYVIIRLLGTRVKVHWAIVLLYQALGQMFFGPLGMLIAQQRYVALDKLQVALCLLCGLLGFWSQAAMTWGMQREKSATASLARQGLAPVSALILQLVFLPGDAVLWTTFAGFGCIITGLAVAVVAKTRRSSAATPSPLSS
ncbi:unnamed protein product [Polarella glacialis]|uniref:EamA domain-containing protein n=1 Tax=Polarella glacialis TaxID=89957 RepID=A0A813GGG3_POLGL|nr:unnamed protein product [Polarella glacialis]CAE8732363.1 unnamed protein product [Polarella glacialis]